MNKIYIISKVLAISHLSHSLSGKMDETTETLLGEALDTVRHRTDLLGDEDESIGALIRLAEAVISPVGFPYTTDRIISEINTITGDEDSMFISSFEESIPVEEMDIGDKKGILRREIYSIRAMFAERALRGTLEKKIAILRSRTLTGKGLLEYKEELIAELESIPVGGDGKDPSLVAAISTHNDRAEIEEMLGAAIDMASSSTVWRFNWKRLNTGLVGGGRPGDWIMLAALEHGYKTSLANSIFEGMAIYNDPRKFIRNPKLQPALVRFSFEDHLTNDLYYLWQALKYTINYSEGKPEEVPDATRIKPSDMYDQLLPYLERKVLLPGAEEIPPKGTEDWPKHWQLFLERYNPDNWGYLDMINRCSEIIAEGHEIHGILLDYLFTMSTKGCDHGTHGADKRSLLRKTRAYTTSITSVGLSPTQLSPMAKKMVADGGRGPDFLPSIRGAGMFADTSKVGEECDILIYANVIDRGPGRSALHLLIDKHRSPLATKDPTKREFFLRFTSAGAPVPDDVLLPDGKEVGMLRMPAHGGMSDGLFE